MIYTKEIAVCYFGSHKKDYSRNNIIKKGLRENGIRVLDCGSRDNILLRSFILFYKFFRIHRDVDVIFVSEMSHASMPCAKMLSIIFGKKIIFDPLISAYDTIVEDRKLLKKGSVLSKIIFLLDKICLKMADVVIADTKEHAEYFSSRLGIRSNKIRVVPVGADTDYYYPSPKESQTTPGVFKVLFQGTYIPLHGIKYIIQAAKNLQEYRDIHFTLIGQGQLYDNILSMVRDLKLDNITFIPLVNQNELRERINESDLCLGIFGETEKAKRVIPNKIYQYLACSKPIVTGENTTIKGFLNHRHNVYFCDMADANSLSEAILDLKGNNSLRKEIAENGYKTFHYSATPSHIGEKATNVVSDLLNRS